jgi:hypothetical protein
VSVTQGGDRNEADVDQLGTNNTATVTQTGGDDNDAVVSQGRIAGYPPSTDGVSSGNSATVVQSGSDNRGFYPGTGLGDGGVVYQGLLGGTSTGNTATVTQLGDAGAAAVVQAFRGRAAQSTGTIVQDATNNSALIDQGVVDPAAVGQSESTADVARIGQSGGAGNAAAIFQAYGAGSVTSGNDAKIDQSGSGHYADVRQGRDTDASDGEAIVEQSGAGHQAYLTQSGIGNEADVSQDGTLSYVRLDQSGTSSATVVQEGTPASGDARNVVLLDQTLGAADVTQGGSRNHVWGPGTAAPTSYQDAHSQNSQLTVRQTGADNTLYLDQTDSAATVTSHGSFNVATVVQQ